jgi:hypothetical protein
VSCTPDDVTSADLKVLRAAVHRSCSWDMSYDDREEVVSDILLAAVRASTATGILVIKLAFTQLKRGRFFTWPAQRIGQNSLMQIRTQRIGDVRRRWKLPRPSRTRSTWSLRISSTGSRSPRRGLRSECQAGLHLDRGGYRSSDPGIDRPLPADAGARTTVRGVVDGASGIEVHWHGSDRSQCKSHCAREKESKDEHRNRYRNEAPHRAA